MATEFTTFEEVEPLVKGAINAKRRTFVEKQIRSVSVRLAARYPTLITRWKEPDSADNELLKDLVSTMVEGAVAKVVNNPDGFSSETMGPFAYSKFDSEDPLKGLFDAADLKALDELLAVDASPVRGIQIRPQMGPGAPVTYSGVRLADYRRRPR